MRDFLTEAPKLDKSVLLCGKGPTFSQIGKVNLPDYSVWGLNHVAREIPVDYAHIIDLDVVEQIGPKLLENAKFLVMPYYPHLGWRPHHFLTLQDLCIKNPIISKMDKEGRVFGYNLSTSAHMLNAKWNDSPLVYANKFSAEAVVSLLGRHGVKRIQTLGVDGGKGQAEQFKDLQNINTSGYNAEWEGIRKSIKKFGINYGPLGVESPIRIFVGAGKEQLIPALVLKHSILKHATMSVEVTPMIDWVHPMPKDPKNRPRTPFSFQRFMIPSKISGKMGIYMDSDMLCFADVKEIWCEPTREGLLTMRHDDIDKHKAKFAVCRYDGVLYHPNIQEIVDGLDSGKWTYEDVVFEFKHEIMGIRDGFNPDWNSLEEYIEGKTKLLHFTEMYNQPWLVNPNHPLGYLWFNELKEAVKDGSIDRLLVEVHVQKGWILPKCLEVLNG